jgi:hypothetical protein
VHRAAPQEAVIPIEIVITGLDPVIHLLRKGSFWNDGLPGQARQ